jgi:hypothetical protein
MPSELEESSNAKADAVAVPPADRLKIRHRKPRQKKGLYVDQSLRRIAGRPSRGASSSAHADRQQDGIRKRPLYTPGNRSPVKIGAATFQPS